MFQSLKVNCSNKIGQSKKAPKPALSRNWNLGILDSGLPPKPNAKSNIIVPYEDTELLQSDDSLLCSSPALSLDASPTQSDPSISTHDSLTNHVVDYMVESTTDDGNDDDDDEIVNIDSDLMDPQLCASFACDIYEHLRVSEVGWLLFYSATVLILI